MLIVQKFGGSSLADRQRIFAVAEIVARTARAGNRVVAVVSAQADTTDELMEKAAAVNPLASLRELDAFLSTGEQLSAALLAMALEKMGLSAVSLAGWQVGLRTDGNHGNAWPLELTNRRIAEELDRGKIVVVTGFQGLDDQGDITTLGRGGSDTTAVALAGFLGADRCQIFTDVDGVYDADPKKNPRARKFDQISYGQMERLIAGGAQVLHDRSVELAKRFGIRIEVLSSFSGNAGTLVG